MKVRTEVVFCHILAEDCKTKGGAMSNKCCHSACSQRDNSHNG